MNKEDRQLNRNLNGIKFEKEGDIEGAIKLYEKNLQEDFEGNHPYDRLAIIYRKREQIQEEIRILKKAIFVFENIVHEGRSDRLPKLEKFKKRLRKVLEVNEKS